MAATQTNLDIDFEITSQSSLKLDVQGFDGTESVSSLYGYTIYATTSSNVAIASLIGERAKLTVTATCGQWVTCGICAQIVELEKGRARRHA